METSSQNGGRQTQRAQERQSPQGNLPESQEADHGRGAAQPAERGRSVAARRASLQSSTWSGNPFDTMLRLSREMDQLMESFFGSRFTFPGRLGEGGGPRGGAPEIWAPRVDVRQRGEDLTITAELPGVPRDAIQIEASEDGIAISGERQETRQEGDRERGYQLSERSYGSFYRDIPLPEGADVEQAKASMRDGVLEITVPLRPGQGRRQIAISD
ncbi:MAG TPA: Hsp20/alpha crystallin family protein [Steroidobacteraceae bacterium]|nr:Hsp20/alpha crystallin family protein [Steroidobacteraceae bacterium]